MSSQPEAENLMIIRKVTWSSILWAWTILLCLMIMQEQREHPKTSLLLLKMPMIQLLQIIQGQFLLIQQGLPERSSGLWSLEMEVLMMEARPPQYPEPLHYRHLSWHPRPLRY